MNTVGIDHWVLTVEDVDRTCAFYSSPPDADVRTFDGGRTTHNFGDQKVNLRSAGDECRPHAARPFPVRKTSISAPISRSSADGHLDETGVAVVHGPVDKIGALGPMRSDLRARPRRKPGGGRTVRRKNCERLGRGAFVDV